MHNVNFSTPLFHLTLSTNIFVLLSLRSSFFFFRFMNSTRLPLVYGRLDAYRRSVEFLNWKRLERVRERERVSDGSVWAGHERLWIWRVYWWFLSDGNVWSCRLKEAALYETDCLLGSLPLRDNRERRSNHTSHLVVGLRPPLLSTITHLLLCGGSRFLWPFGRCLGPNSRPQCVAFPPPSVAGLSLCWWADRRSGVCVWSSAFRWMRVQWTDRRYLCNVFCLSTVRVKFSIQRCASLLVVRLCVTHRHTHTQAHTHT